MRLEQRMTKLLWNVGMYKKDGVTSTEVAKVESSVPSVSHTTLFLTIPIYHVFLTHQSITLHIATADISII
jgi:hypothetical protein